MARKNTYVRYTCKFCGRVVFTWDLFSVNTAFKAKSFTEKIYSDQSHSVIYDKLERHKDVCNKAKRDDYSDWDKAFIIQKF